MEGSKKIEVSITIKSILERMKDMSYYIGESAKSNPQIIELGAKIQASDDEDPLLNDFISDGLSIVSNLLSAMVGESKYASSQGIITISVSATSNTPDIGSELKDYATNYLSAYTLEKWLEMIKPDESARYKENRSRMEAEMAKLAARRKKPVREQ